ncbi:MAG: AraC family transcriptional regulator [Oscillospiraceae bacterium]|nr:AraC family transcriptional regulator [Oscillospiraceae bacterium]
MSLQYTEYISKYSFPVSGVFSGRLSSELWPVSVKPLVDNRLSDEHWHEGLQIWYTLSGEYNHKINGVWHKQTAGSVSIVHPYSVHQIDSRNSKLDELNVISMSVPKRMFSENNIPFYARSYISSSFDLFSIASSLKLSGNDKRRADVLLEDSLTEFRNHRDMDIQKIVIHAASFLELCSRQNCVPLSKKEISSAKEKFECIENALFYIFKNYTSPLTLEHISREAMMSQRTFTSSFGEVVGRTCHNYVTTTRMTKALYLLKVPTNSLDMISDECGFYDRTHFIKLFKNTFHTTPTLWREDYLRWKEQNEIYQLMSECREHGWLRPDAMARLKNKIQMQA